MVAKLETTTLNSAHREDEYCSDLEDPYEEEEALSLCDLPIYSDSFKWDDDFSSSTNNLDQSSSSFGENDDDRFEFFSEDFTSSTYPSAKKDIIFCGKLIPYKESPLVRQETQHHQSQNMKNDNRKRHPRSKTSIFQRWKSYSFSKKDDQKYKKKPRKLQYDDVKSKNDNKSTTTTLSYYDKRRKCGSNSFPATGKVSVLSSPVKTRWHLYLFGMKRFPVTAMELRDIRTRQSRRRSPSTTMFFPFDDNESTETTKEKVSSTEKSKRRSAKGLWGLLRALRCRSRHAKVVAKATIGCSVPQPRRWSGGACVGSNSLGASSC